VLNKVELDPHTEIWEKFGPYSCTLNVDEVDDLSKTWKEISDKIGVPVDEV
jgi:alanyl-tRNA synthetase